MAKDTRNKQVALKQENERPTASSAAKKRKKKKSTPLQLILKVLLGVFLVVLLIFLFVIGRYVFTYFKTDDGEDTTIPVEYETTADSALSKVSYYMVGLMGENSTDPLSALALLCFDKKANTLDVLQLPMSTYMGKTEGWDVTTVDAVWSLPKSLTWCDRCRGRVFAPEVSKENTHTVCGEPLTTKKGSATESLIDVFNDCYGMPVDAFFIIPRAALAKLVDIVGGVEVELSASVTLADEKYSKGKQRLDGAAVLAYATETNYKSTPDSDIVRMQQQRQVFTALFRRLTSLSAEELHDEVIDPLMSGSTPIRVTETVASRRAMMAGLTRENPEDVDNEKAMCALLTGLAKLDPTAMQYHIVPGESVKSSGKTVFSVHKKELLTLLADRFNPYGAALSEADLGFEELKTSKKANLYTATFAAVAPAQTATLSDGTEEGADD